MLCWFMQVGLQIGVETEEEKLPNYSNFHIFIEECEASALS